MTKRPTPLDQLTPGENAAEPGRNQPEPLDQLGAHLAALAGMDPPPAAKDAFPPTAVLPAAPKAAPTTAAKAWPSVPGYEILEEVGRGGMAVVYKARQIALDRIVALKTILPSSAGAEEERTRFLREARVMALLQHPNVIQIHEIGYSGDRPFLAMEFMGGGSLAASLAGKPMSPQQAAALVAVLADAVQRAHQQGVIHRDLKPGNILLSAEGTAKIGDFGLAKWFALPNSSAQQTQVMGTPSYMAPEQAFGRCALGPAVDVYALGAILYELLTGRPPFLSDNPLDTLHLVDTQEPIPPRRWQPKVPRDLETICLKCLEKEPRRRYASARALCDDLQQFSAGKAISARPAGPLEHAWRWARHHRVAAALLSAAVAALLAVVAIVGFFNRRLAAELDRTAAEHRRVLKTEGQLDQTLTRSVARRLDSDLRELAAIPLTMAALLEKTPNWNDSRLEKLLRDLLGKQPMIFGICVAMEPHQWRADREDFALYVYRSRGGLAAHQLVPPVYQPGYRQWPWYYAAKQAPQGRWCEPYVDPCADRTPMVTFSAPIHRQGRFVGVVTADLAMDYFRWLRNSVETLDLGPKTYCFVLSAGGRILAHRDDCFEFPNADSDAARIPADKSFRDLLARMRRDAGGTATAVDFSSGRPATFRFAPVPTAGWTVVLVRP
ncbi:MAG: protein kinase domain-containing protein [Thermoguttaceae bacterium]